MKKFEVSEYRSIYMCVHADFGIYDIHNTFEGTHELESKNKELILTHELSVSLIQLRGQPAGAAVVPTTTMALLGNGRRPQDTGSGPHSSSRRCTSCLCLLSLPAAIHLHIEMRVARPMVRTLDFGWSGCGFESSGSLQRPSRLRIDDGDEVRENRLSP